MLEIRRSLRLRVSKPGESGFTKRNVILSAGSPKDL